MFFMHLIYGTGVVMNLSYKIYSLCSALYLVSGLFLSSTSFAERGANGGFHQGGDMHGTYHQDDVYHSDNGYLHDDNIYHNDNPVVLDANNGINCQSVQQCDSDGYCIETQNCN